MKNLIPPVALVFGLLAYVGPSAAGEPFTGTRAIDLRTPAERQIGAECGTEEFVLVQAGDTVTGPQRQIAKAQSLAERANPLSSYQPKTGMEGRAALEEIYFKGVPVTLQSFQAVRRLLSDGRLSRDEKVIVPRLLAGLHNSDNSTGANAEIELDLQVLANDPDKEIAAQAAVHYARMGYLPETESVLRQAFKAGALPPDSYYQELAHLIASAPAQKQAEIMATIRESSNGLARDVLTSALLSGKDFNGASFLRSSPDMAAFLRATQPEFSYAASQLGLVDAVRYAHWLRASATIESDRTGRSMDAVIVDTLSAPGTDPRKIIGYLVQPQAAPVLASATPESPVYNLVEAAQDYAAQFPASGMKDLVAAVVHRMPNPPPARAPIAPATGLPTRADAITQSR